MALSETRPDLCPDSWKSSLIPRPHFLYMRLNKARITTAKKAFLTIIGFLGTCLVLMEVQKLYFRVNIALSYVVFTKTGNADHIYRNYLLKACLGNLSTLEEYFPDLSSRFWSFYQHYVTLYLFSGLVEIRIFIEITRKEKDQLRKKAQKKKKNKENWPCRRYAAGPPFCSQGTVMA